MGLISDAIKQGATDWDAAFALPNSERPTGGYGGGAGALTEAKAEPQRSPDQRLADAIKRAFE